MSEQTSVSTEEQGLLAHLNRPAGRRTFLKWSGVSAAALAVGACEDTEIVRPEDLPGGAVVLDFSSDIGVLNYAYALEQLEAAFYTQVAASFYTGITAEERAVLEDLRDHEIAHREFFRAAIPADQRIGALTPDFSMVDFTSRQSVLTVAQTFEDLGVGAYNGAAKYLESADYVVVAGKIVSVEGRHAAAIRDLLDPLTFAPNVTDPALEPSAVLEAANPFIATEIRLVNVPTISIS